MRSHELETWVRNIVERVQNHEPDEDGRVELKAAWIDPVKAARRIAGHANAAHGAPILWIIGVDQKKHVVTGAKPEELSEWHAKVEARFNGLAPNLLMDLNVPVDDKTVVALLFETDRAPYVVKVPDHDRLEVPWRQGTRTRSATRADLLRLLSPLQKLPEFEVLSGYISASKINDPKVHWNINLVLYANTQSEESVFIPFHKCYAQLEIPGCLELTKIKNISLQPPRATGMPSTRSRRIAGNSLPPRRDEGIQSMTIDATKDELVIRGPGRINLTAGLSTERLTNLPTSGAKVEVSLFPIGADKEIKLHLSMMNDQLDYESGYIAFKHENEESIVRRIFG